MLPKSRARTAIGHLQLTPNLLNARSDARGVVSRRALPNGEPAVNGPFFSIHENYDCLVLRGSLAGVLGGV
jgi:hypothetical protein